MMWLCGYWLERGHKLEEILSLSKDEQAVWQAIAELNEEKERQKTIDNMVEAFSIVLDAFLKGS